MLAIATLLDPASDQQTRDLWQLLEEKCGLFKIKTAPYPHFTWFGCEDLNWKPVRQKITRIVHSLNNLKVRTSGIGLFTGPVPVLFVSIVKSPELVDIHRKMWQRLGNDFIGAQELYLPEQWMPHITIAHGDLTPENLTCAINELALKPLSFDILINNISIIYHSEESVGIKDQFAIG